ncbi:MAG: polysaccharide biosynthesis PFTS motif protein [Candidatus Omnitrophica bacterium]|nr:polysaccharide biosynthesis PFTS motif protein [Candidatus Omnitrophota bacterium]MBU1808353.1 polysaccharide biosynthesis PFTS motif protein [Candidatus Omnitrophota bacterium]
MNKKRVTIFEELAPRNRLAVMYCLHRGDTVCFLRLNENSLSAGWINALIGSKKIERLDMRHDLNLNDFAYHDKAFDNVDKFFSLMSQSSTLARMRILCKSDYIDLVYKKEITKRLARLYYINFIVSRLQSVYCDKDIKFVPSNGMPPYQYRTDGCEVCDYRRFYLMAKRCGANIEDTGINIFPAILLPGMYIKAGVRRVLTVLKVLSLCSYIIIRQIVSLSGARRRPSRQYKYGIMVVSPERQFANRVRKVDFLIDGTLIKKSEVLFIAYRKMGKACRSYLDDNDLAYVDVLDEFFSVRRTSRAVLEYCMLILRLPDVFLTDLSASIIHYHLRWTSFTQTFGIDALVTHCDIVVQSIVRNIVLGKRGSKTFYYMDSSNLGSFMQKTGRIVEFRHSNLGFFYYDYFLAWNEHVMDYFKRSHCKIINYVNVGCLWAEHLELISSGQITSGLVDKLRGCGYRQGMKLIAVFDSTFHDNSLTTCSDGIDFLKGVRRLLDDLPDLFMVIKEKMAIHIHTDSRPQDLIAAYDRLKLHARCYAADKKDSPSEIIAFSDMVISFPFTSTSFEALSARKRAVWYDASGKFKNTFFDAIPGLVCHDYKEMFERVSELLLRMADADYDHYLDSQVKGRVESYLDCKAITRMRKLLNSNSSVPGEALRKSRHCEEAVVGRYADEAI